jgi:hypothetical protein
MKPKKGTGNQDSKSKPIESQSKKGKVSGPISGSPDSTGGSRDGNAGHQSTPEGGKGDRQV